MNESRRGFFQTLCGALTGMCGTFSGLFGSISPNRSKSDGLIVDNDRGVVTVGPVTCSASATLRLSDNWTPKWVDLEKEMPEPGIDLLVEFDNGGVGPARLVEVEFSNCLQITSRSATIDRDSASWFAYSWETIDGVPIVNKVVRWSKFKGKSKRFSDGTLRNIRWIPVTERLPDSDYPVLVCSQEHDSTWMCIGWNFQEVGWVTLEKESTRKITHWAELPSPPSPPDDINFSGEFAP